MELNAVPGSGVDVERGEALGLEAVAAVDAMKGRFMMTGLAIEFGALVIRYAFGTYPLRKLYLEMPDYNRGALEQVLSKYTTLKRRYPNTSIGTANCAPHSFSR